MCMRIVTPHDGPTNKADCMNWIYHGIMSFERQNAMRFQIFTVQDCEDVVHRLCYRLFNFLIPRFDMVQLPVLSLPRKWYEFTGSHYKDEFAQLHFKDMIVREVLSGSIPSAGVGCAFSRRALETIARHHQNAIFNIRSLTEDYELGVTLKSHGLQAVFVKYTASRTVVAKGLFARRSRLRHVNELVCVREYFPSGLRAAMRQKSRWVLGIALQGWANLGWQGGFWTRYMFVRDRKALVTNLVTVLGYFVVLVVLAVWMTIWIDPDAYRYPPLLEQGSLLWYVVIANAALLAERIVVRAYCVYRVYGWQQALLSVPRMPWGNFINFGATCRALRLYARSLLTGKPIAWDKTTHVYPSEEVLHGYRRKIGDLLLERRMITATQLEEALHRQKTERRLLGSILVDMGAIQEPQLQQVLHVA
jgi:bacteriophage N4 adsorption protein B